MIHHLRHLDHLPTSLPIKKQKTPTTVFLIVDVGTPLDYRVPSFPVLVVTMRHMRFEVEGENVDIVKYDGFIKDHDSLDQKVPGVVVVTESCYVDVS